MGASFTLRSRAYRPVIVTPLETKDQMQNIMENYRLALAARKAARKAEAKAHKHKRRVQQYMHDRNQMLLTIAREDQEYRERIAERNEMAGLVFCIDARDEDQDEDEVPYDQQMVEVAPGQWRARKNVDFDAALAAIRNDYPTE